MKASIKLFLRNDYKNKDGKSPVYLRLTINKNKKYYATGIFIHADDLLKKGPFAVKIAIENSSNINIQLRDVENRANTILNDFARYETPPTFQEFDKLFNNKVSRKSFYQFALDYINSNSEFSSETVRTYKSYLPKLNEFLPYSKQTFQEINNLDFIKAYKSYMINTLHNKLNTYSKSLSFFRTILNEAKKYSLISTNEYEKIQIKREPGKRVFLVIEQIDELLEFYNSNKISKKHKNVLQYFLFACYTGLRYKDVKRLRHKHIKNYLAIIEKKKQERLLVNIKMHKTKRDVVIPLIEKAISLIDFSENHPNNYVFDVKSNQNTNDYIKEIMQKMKYDFYQEVTFHCARHSFATHCIRMGMPIKSTSQTLGHTSVKTTEIYTHLVKDAVINEIDKVFK
jgi:site-specific recombinase XerD